MDFRWPIVGLLLGAASASLAVLPLAASAQGNVPDNFYAGKTISIIVDGTGAYESYARTLARHLPRHIPGQPKIIVQAMPGASGPSRRDLSLQSRAARRHGHRRPAWRVVDGAAVLTTWRSST